MSEHGDTPPPPKPDKDGLGKHNSPEKQASLKALLERQKRARMDAKAEAAAIRARKGNGKAPPVEAPQLIQPDIIMPAGTGKVGVAGGPVLAWSRDDHNFPPGSERDYEPKPPRKHALRYTRYRDIALDGAKRALFKGLINYDELSYWIGPPGSLKSSLLTEMTVHAAAGLDWRGCRNKAGPVAVVYFALERADLVKRRLAAYRERLGLPDLPIAVVKGVINLLHCDCVEAIIDTVLDVGDDYGLPVGLIIIDTVPKGINAGGGDEDKAKDKGTAFANLRKVQDRIDVHIAGAGHTGKDESRGGRGSNTDIADADLQTQIAHSGDVRSATITKANDRAEGPLWGFRGVLHSFGTDEDGDPVEVFIVAPESVEAEAPQETARKQPPKHLRFLRQAFVNAGDPVDKRPYADGPEVQAIKAETVRAVFLAKYPGGDGDKKQQADTRRTAWRSALREAALDDNGFVGYREIEGVEWLWLL